MNIATKTASTGTGEILNPSTGTTSAGGFFISQSSSKVTTTTRAQPTRDVERAVYAYIQAVRALGKTKVETEEIARALGLGLSEVERTVKALRSRGVKPVG
jgi:hypothetical protein